MSFTRNIAFYAAIKPPDHPIPSGDRLIAANLFQALKTGGHKVHLASRYICYSKRSAAEYFNDRKEGALAEADRLTAHYLGQTEPHRPDLWITYHPYCKAPDWIGPRVSAALGIPYVTVEAARTNQGVDGEWDPWREDAQAGLKQAARHLWFKPTDRDYLKRLLGGEEKLARIPVFLDSSAETLASPAALPGHWKPETPVLVTAGMMRKGKKLENYRILARVLDGVQETPWNLVLVGGGPEEDAVRDAFGGISSERLHFTGEITQPEVLQWMRASNLFIWPGWKEPIGMVYLEAQLQGTAR